VLAWVLGATGAWGGAIARELLAAGVDVVALGRRPDPALAAEAARLGRSCGFARLDLAEPVPPLEALVAAAGPGPLGGIPDVLVDAAFVTEGDREALLEANFLAKAALIDAVATAMRARGSGRIGVLVGQNGRLGLAGLADLSAPQGALWTWAEARAEELRAGPDDVRLTVVIPPRTASQTQRAVAERSGRTAKLRPPDAGPIVGAILAGRRRAGRRPILAGLALLIR
jgi:NADP-dependent 3-hydroxy acid dehydrogenase YdfG